jgi:hypothetical protein
MRPRCVAPVAPPWLSRGPVRSRRGWHQTALSFWTQWRRRGAAGPDAGNSPSRYRPAAMFVSRRPDCRQHSVGHIVALPWPQNSHIVAPVWPESPASDAPPSRWPASHCRPRREERTGGEDRRPTGVVGRCSRSDRPVRPAVAFVRPKAGVSRRN